MARWKLAVGLGLVGLTGGAYVFLDLTACRPAPRRPACVNNLKQLALVLSLYSNENQDRLPPLDQRPGSLMFDGNVIFPEYLADVDVLGCPSDPRYDPTRNFHLARVTEWHAGLRPGAPHPDCLDTTSYQYLGYTIETDTELRVFLDAGGPDAFVPGTRASDTELGILSYDPKRPAIGPLLGMPVPFACTVADREAERLRFAYLCDRDARALPLMWERPKSPTEPGGHRDGDGNMLFMDGHVESLRVQEQDERFPVSPFSREWLLAQVPAPSGNPADPWGDCP